MVCAATFVSSTTSSHPPPTKEVQDAALQYVRKISGSTKPSQANAEAFEQAVEEVAAATRKLLDTLTQRAAEGPGGRGGEGACSGAHRYAA